MAGYWSFTETDRRAVEEMDARLPARLFDAHAHLYRVTDLDVGDSPLFSEGPAEVDLAQWRRHIGRQVGEQRLAGGLFIPDPRPLHGIGAVNEYVLAQVADDADSRAAVLVAPDMPREMLDGWLATTRVAALKPYHLLCDDRPTFDAALESYCAEWVWQLAHDRGLAMILHLVRKDAIADPGNQESLSRLCRQYPNARVVLAHAARSFHAPNARKGLGALRGLENLYFDTAVVCEQEPLLEILDQFGPRKLLWGSDFAVSQMRGRCVTLGEGFAWLTPESLDWEKLSPPAEGLLVGLEALRALLTAADTFGLNDADLRDVFCDNALRLFGMLQAPGTLTQQMYRHARERMPGGTGLLSKRPEMLAPEQWPGYFREARGCEVWDLDGRHYYDFASNGISACLLGYRDPDVTAAVGRRLRLGSASTLNPPEEIELADRLCEIHPWAEQVRFARTGGETAAVAIRIARATTDRSVVAVCGYHGWHDWYLAANLGEDDSLRGHLLPGLDPLGVPRELRGTTLTFTHGKLDELEAIIDSHGDRLAVVIMEPCRYTDPEPGFLHGVLDAAHRCGALVIFDEITIGWRLVHGGAHLRFGANPDMAIFSKALGNGHPIGAVLGTRAAMEGCHDSFISSTQWTESIGPTAALAAIEKMERTRVTEHVAHIGSRVQDIWRQMGEKHRLPVHADEGFPCLPHLKFIHEQGEALRTLYTQWMLDRGFLAVVGFSPTLAHTDATVDLFAEAVDEVFAQIAEAVATDRIEQSLRGPVAHSGFRRLT